MKKSNNKKGFTLVELVIVVAVIAILSAILIPTIGNVIKDAKDAAVKSDIKTYVANKMIESEVDVDNEYFLQVEEKGEGSSKTYTVVAIYKWVKGEAKVVNSIESGYVPAGIPEGSTGRLDVTINGELPAAATFTTADPATTYTCTWIAYGNNGLYILKVAKAGSTGTL